MQVTPAPVPATTPAVSTATLGLPTALPTRHLQHRRGSVMQHNEDFFSMTTGNASISSLPFTLHLLTYLSMSICVLHLLTRFLSLSAAILRSMEEEGTLQAKDWALFPVQELYRKALDQGIPWHKVSHRT